MAANPHLLNRPQHNLTLDTLLTFARDMVHQPTGSEDDAEREECVIPGPIAPEALQQYLLNREPFDGADSIGKYVESQSPEESVTYLERISEERVLSRDHIIWDVHTSGERYWVITNPTNLYSQRLFPSADFTLSFHVGLTARVSSQRTSDVSAEEHENLAVAWRKWTQAAEMLDRSKEAEEFQSVGMRCREALVTLARELSDDSMVPANAVAPKAADFMHWAEFIAQAYASGSHNTQVRSYLKTISRSSWQLVSWLTHTSGAVRLDAEIAVDGTRTVIAAFGMASLRFEQGVPSRCPVCSSYKISSVYIGELSDTMPYAPICQACGWSNTRVDGSDGDQGV